MKRVPLLALAIVALVGLGVHLLLHIPLWAAFGFPLLGLLINVLVRSKDS